MVPLSELYFLGSVQAMSIEREEKLLQDFGWRELEKAFTSKAFQGPFQERLQDAIKRFSGHGRHQAWAQAIEELPCLEKPTTLLDRAAPTVHLPASSVGVSWESSLHDLGPWKKGPFDIFGLHLDAEWRSDLKWSRVQEQISPLKNRKVLDVGTGNGYFLLRAMGDGASHVLGLEPSAHYAAQFLALRKLYQPHNTALLPLTSDEFAQQCQAFDTVLSMGVLYHRRSPLDHLAELRSFTKSGGQLVLETIVVDGPTGYSLVPEGRYAQMRNVWFLPSVGTLESWLKRLGFSDITSGPIEATTSEEQRSTTWTGQPSLADFLDPHDPKLTVEGHPAPKRVIITATAP